MANDKGLYKGLKRTTPGNPPVHVYFETQRSQPCWQSSQSPAPSTVAHLPMVQLEVIFRLFGLCFSSSSSRLVGSQVENFSPTPKRMEDRFSSSVFIHKSDGDRTFRSACVSKPQHEVFPDHIILQRARKNT